MRPSVFVATVALVMAATSLAFATGFAGTIKAAYSTSTGRLRILTASDPVVHAGERPITWNVRGLQGSRGATGPAGDNAEELAADFWPGDITYNVEPVLSVSQMQPDAPVFLRATFTPELTSAPEVGVPYVRAVCVLHLPHKDVSMPAAYSDLQGYQYIFEHSADLPQGLPVDGSTVDAEFWFEWGGFIEHRTVPLTVSAGS